MKKLFIAFCLLTGIAQFGQAQVSVPVDTLYVIEYPPINNIFKISPFHFAEATFLMSYERFLSETVSLQVSAGLHSRESSWQAQNGFGTQEELQARFYLLKPENSSPGARQFFFFKGLYAGPYLYHRWRQQEVFEWDWVAQQNVPVDQNINEVSGGVIIGAQIALGNVFYMDLFTGGGIKRSFGRSESTQQFYDITSVGYNGVLPKIGFNIGVGF